MARTNRKIKILFTIPNFNTAGSGKALLKVAQKLNPQIFDVHIACMHSKGAFFKVVEQSGFPIHILNYIHPMTNRLKGLVYCYKISREFKKIQPDIIHSYNYSADYSEGIAARLAGIKWVYTKKNMSWGGASANSWRLRTLMAHCIAYQNEDMRTDFFPDLKKVYYLPRGVDYNEFQRVGDKESVIKEFKIEAGEKIIICVANIVPVKGLEVLLSSFNQLLNNGLKVRLLLVGDYENEYGIELVDKVKKMDNNHKVCFTGKRPDVARLLSSADVFVLPTLDEGRKEGSPVALLEAMSIGIPVIASRIAGIKDQLKEFPELMFEAGNQNQLFDQLIKLLNADSSSIEELGQKLRKTVLDQFTIEEEVKRHENMYLSLMNEKE